MDQPTTPTSPPRIVFFDIWSRPGLWARQRAYIFLSVNICVYAALNMFVFWIQNGRVIDFSWESYGATYHKTLIDMVVTPLSVQDTPVLIPIVGMLMAVVIIVPILISQLYGFRFSIIFAAEALVFGHLPVLSLFLIACSFIAGASKHMLPFKFGVAVLSLLPIAIYFYVATRGAPALQMKLVDPTLLYAPWVVAFVAAAAIAAAVLAFAKLVKYRPGGILISMIPFFAIPGLLFHHYIGADQLEFRLLARHYGTDGENLSIDVTQKFLQETVRSWQRFKLRDFQAILDMAQQIFPSVAQEITHNHRMAIIEACQRFQRQFGASHFLPNCLFVRALAEDMRFDYTILMQDWQVSFHTDLVSPTSRLLWRQLIDEYPDSLYAQPARYRLAVIATRRGQIDQAVRLLSELVDHDAALVGQPQTMPAESGTLRNIFVRRRESAIPPVDLAAVKRNAEKLLELIQNNADDPKFGYKPLADLLNLDPHHPKWRTHLLDLAVRYSGSKLHDDLLVLYAVSEPDPRSRQRTLQRYADQFKDQDAGALALFELARTTRALALVDLDPAAVQTASDLFHRVIRQYPRHQSLCQQAIEELAKLAQWGDFRHE